MKSLPRPTSLTHARSLVDTHPDLQTAAAAPTRTAVLVAFSKLLWIQNDFFSKYYITKSKGGALGENGKEAESPVKA